MFMYFMLIYYSSDMTVNKDHLLT